MLVWLGDDVEITIRPRLQRTRRGAIRVIQAAAVERPEEFEPVRLGRGKRSAGPAATSTTDGSDENTDRSLLTIASATRDDKQLLNKHAVENMTSLDITTIYRRMAEGTFPQPVRIGRRRVAWRTSDIVRWQQNLEVGTETVRRRAERSGEDHSGPQGKGRRARG
jgi:prophage regulatory protein